VKCFLSHAAAERLLFGIPVGRLTCVHGTEVLRLDNTWSVNASEPLPRK
jgi:hypothetical protein